MKIICFDIGGTKILKAVVEVEASNFKFIEIEEEGNPRNEGDIKKIMTTYCDISQRMYKTKKVGISMAGIVDSEKKTVIPPKWLGKNKFNFSFLARKKFSIEVENDGRCFAMGEFFFGKARGKKNILALALGTWVGGGCILDGKNFRGHHSSSMEVSHTWIGKEKIWRKWGEFSAGRAIEEAFYDETKKKIACEEIFKLARKKSKVAKSIIENSANFLGVGIANLCNILDPELIVFGGSISRQKEYINTAIQIARKKIMNKKANYKFVISALGNKSNLLGAASLWLK